jgi:hypothetical protein
MGGKSEKQSADAILDTSLTRQAYTSNLTRSSRSTPKGSLKSMRFTISRADCFTAGPTTCARQNCPSNGDNGDEDAEGEEGDVPVAAAADDDADVSPPSLLLLLLLLLAGGGGCRRRCGDLGALEGTTTKAAEAAEEEKEEEEEAAKEPAATGVARNVLGRVRTPPCVVPT